MKKTLSTIIVAVFVVLTTATFGYAEYVATGASNFPYFHPGCLIVGDLIITSLKNKYQGMCLSEAIGSFLCKSFISVLFAATSSQYLYT